MTRASSLYWRQDRRFEPYAAADRPVRFRRPAARLNCEKQPAHPLDRQLRIGQKGHAGLRGEQPRIVRGRRGVVVVLEPDRYDHFVDQRARASKIAQLDVLGGQIELVSRDAGKIRRRERELIALRRSALAPWPTAIEALARSPCTAQLLVDVRGHARFDCAGPRLIGRDEPLGSSLYRIFNLAGVPALSVPCGFTGAPDPLPVEDWRALAADFRIASEKANFVAAFSKIGLIPDSGMTWILPRLVGLSRALEIAWLSDAIPAGSAAGFRESRPLPASYRRASGYLSMTRPIPHATAASCLPECGSELPHSKAAGSGR